MFVEVSSEVAPARRRGMARTVGRGAGAKFCRAITSSLANIAGECQTATYEVAGEGI